MARCLVLDGSAVADRAALHDALARLLRFPDFYGRNWDALRDCMEDEDFCHVTEPTEVVWEQHAVYAAADPECFAIVQRIFRETELPVTLRLA